MQQTQYTQIIEGICIDPNCKLTQRFMGSKCLKDHDKCQSNCTLTKEEFFQELGFIKSYIQQLLSMQINLKVFLDFKNELLRKIKILEQCLNKIGNEFLKKLQIIDQIDQILQKPLEKKSWMDGYQLIVDKFKIEYNENSQLAVYQQINSIRQSLDGLGQFKPQLKPTSLIDNQAVRRYLAHKQSINTNIHECWNPNDQFKLIQHCQTHSTRTFNVKMMIQQLQCAKDGKSFACSDSKTTIRIFDIQTGKQVGLDLIGHTWTINSIAYSPNDRLLVSGSSDKTVRIWDTQTCKQIVQFIGHFKPVHSVCFAPSGLFIASGSEELIYVHHIVERCYPVRAIVSSMPIVRQMQYNPSGTILLSSSQDKVVRVWNVGTGKLAYISLTKKPVLQSKLSPNGAIIASAQGQYIKIYFSRKNKQINRLRANCFYVNRLSYSPDGQYVVGGLDNGQVMVWNTFNRNQKVIGATLTTVAAAQVLNDGEHVIYPMGQGVTIKRIDFQ